MSKYAICEIAGKQYKILPNKTLLVDFQADAKDIDANVLVLVSDDGKIQVGKPYLKEKIKLSALGKIAGKKVRVSKYHAKANDRTVTGMRPKYTQISWNVKTP